MVLKELEENLILLDEEINECLSHIKTKNEISKRNDALDIQGSSFRIVNFDKKIPKKNKK